MQFPDWGTVPAWISTGSFFIAALAYQRSVLDKERDQASNVSAWIGTIIDGGKRKRVLRVSNTSDAAVFDLFIKPQGSDPVFLLELPAKDSRVVNLQGDPSPVKERTVQASVAFAGVTIERVSASSQATIEPLPILEFCDSAGRWWRRSSRRRVRRIRQRKIDIVTTRVANYSLLAVKVDDTLIPPKLFNQKPRKWKSPDSPDE
jgi:hypothetical protein